MKTDNKQAPVQQESYFKQLISLVPFWKEQNNDWKVTVIRTSLDRFGYKMILAYLSLYVVTLGATKSQLGIITSIGLLVMGCLAPFIGGWIDRNGAKRIYMLGVAILIIAYLTYAFAPTWKVYALAMVLYYIGNGLAMQSCAIICGKCLRNCDRAKGMMICESLAAGLLGMLGPLVGAWLFTRISGVTDTSLAVANDFRPLFIGSAIISVCSFVLVVTRLSNAKMGSATASRFALKDSYRIVKTNKNARKWLFIAAVGYLPNAMVVPYVSVYAAEFKMAAPALLALMVTCQALTSTITGYPVGILADRFGRKKVLFVLVPLIWLALIILMLAPAHKPFFLIIVGLLLGCLDLCGPLFAAVQRELVDPRVMGVWLGTTQFTNAIVSAVMAIVAGFVYDHVSPIMTFVIFLACDVLIRIPLFASIPETLGNEVKGEEEEPECCSE